MNEFNRKAMDLADEMVKAKATENHANLYGSLTRWKEWSDKYDAARAALVAHLEGAEQKWLPIESAPKNMAARLYLVRGVCVQGFVDATGVLCVSTDNRPWRKMVGKPTHWMPLPATPTEDQP